jgi:hypothetical protein
MRTRWMPWRHCSLLCLAEPLVALAGAPLLRLRVQLGPGTRQQQQRRKKPVQPRAVVASRRAGSDAYRAAAVALLITASNP